MVSAADPVRSGFKLFTHKGAYKDLPDGQVRDTRKTGPVSIKEPRNPVISFLSPPAIFAAVTLAGAEKARQPFWKTFWLGILAGIYLSLGCALAFAVGGQLPSLQSSNLGAQKLMFGAFGLPLGLGLIVICGAELWTTNLAYLPAAVYEGRANLMQLAKNWVFSFLGNLCGSLLCVWLIDETYLFHTNAARTYPMYIAEEKTMGPFGNEILRAFFANYLVCLAMWQATAAQDIIGKIFGIFFPVLCFVAIGFSHTIANMFWVPFAMKLGSPVSVGRYIGSSMIPTMIGNGLSATFFLAGSYAFCYGTLPMRVERMWLKLRGKPPSESYEDPSFARKDGIPPAMYGDDSAQAGSKYQGRYAGGVPKESEEAGTEAPAGKSRITRGSIVLPQQVKKDVPEQQHAPPLGPDMV
ncbi:hypothetical protein WJX74_006617 [Apatococcus lobatus]|uniref:Formate/nitrite transporter n=1 Tax=Apatococcus lobatus TaxID=904363 RepID=A0AAW1SGU6_9CHLO